MSGLRKYIRNLEYSLPLALQRPLVRALRETPYSPDYHSTRSIFVHIPKTAGTSVGEAIYGDWVGHVPLSRFAAFDERKFRKYFKFSFVRNPWDRLLSAFAHLKGNGEPLAAREVAWSETHLSSIATFEDFVLKLRDAEFRGLIVNDVHFRPQVDWIILPGSDQIAVDYLGRFESLDEDFAQIARRLGVRKPLAIRKASQRPPYREAYSAAMRGIVDEIFQKDIKLLGYEF